MIFARFRTSLAAALSLAAIAAAATLFAACSGSSSKPTPPNVAPQLNTPTVISATATPDPRPRPTAVPTEADQIRGAAQFGETAGADDATPKLVSLTCADDVITITTTTDVFYAELPCDRSLPDENVRPFVGQPLRVRTVIGDPSKLFMESQGAGTVEFTVGRVWMRPASAAP